MANFFIQHSYKNSKYLLKMVNNHEIAAFEFTVLKS
jgi:hypothetical protein